MTAMAEIINNYKVIKAKFRNPTNAVADAGIDLHRGHRNNPVEKPVPVNPVLEYAKVIVTQIPVKVRVDKNHKVKLTDIEKIVCDYFMVGLVDLWGTCRREKMVYCRHIGWYLACRHTRLSLPQIALSCRRDLPADSPLRKIDHTSVLHAKRKIAMLLESDGDVQFDIRNLEYRLFGSDNHDKSAMAAISQRDLAQEQQKEEGCLPGRTICPVDEGFAMDSQGREVQADQGTVLGNDCPETARQAPN